LVKRKAGKIMKPIQIFLLLFVACEAAGFFVLKKPARVRSDIPAVNWQLGLIDQPTAEVIQQVEKQLDVKSPVSWKELAGYYRAYGLFPQALVCYEAAQDLAPHDWSNLYRWALCLDLVGKTSEAISCYQQILKKAPTYTIETQKLGTHCWLNIGQDYLRQENTTEAGKALRNALDLPKARVLLARILIREGHAQEAITIVEPVESQQPGTIDGHLLHAWAEDALGHPDKARDLYNLTDRCQGQLSKSDPIFRQEVLQLRNEMPSEAWHQKALQLDAQGNLAEAQVWSKKALDVFWTEPRQQELAKLAFKSKNFQEAIRLAQECIDRVGASAETLDIIGVSAYSLSDFNAAREAWQEALLYEPTSNLYHKLAGLARREGNSQAAARNMGLGEYMDGKQAYNINDLANARSHLEKAATALPDHYLTWFYLAETRRLQNDKQGAVSGYQECLRINPDFGRARRALAALEPEAPARPQ
jgi:tetratricopeptide (TPR) repeat protein